MKASAACVGMVVVLTAIAMSLTSCATKAGAAPGAKSKHCVVVWSEGTAPKGIYPGDINTAVAEGLASMKGWEVVKANINDPEQGLPDALLNRADVLIWWGHKKHDRVKDELVQKIVHRVKDEGMGFISLHSSHFAKVNKALMGTECSWGAYVGDSTILKVHVTDPNHPIAKGISDFTINHSERYSDPYAVPKPDALVFDGVHELKDGKSDHSQVGFCWQIGKGRMFYFQAGHETNPVFYDKNVQHILRNAVEWAAPDNR